MDCCWLCNRKYNTNEGRFPVSCPTEHHIVPKQYKKRKKFIDETEQICVACHHQINKMFTNKELLNMTRDELKNHPKIIKWIRWIRKLWVEMMHHPSLPLFLQVPLLLTLCTGEKVVSVHHYTLKVLSLRHVVFDTTLSLQPRSHPR